MSKRPFVIRREYQPDLERQIAALERVLALDLADALARVECMPVECVKSEQSSADGVKTECESTERER